MGFNLLILLGVKCDLKHTIFDVLWMGRVEHFFENYSRAIKSVSEPQLTAENFKLHSV